MKVQIILNLNELVQSPYRDVWERYFGGTIDEQKACEDLGITSAEFDSALAYMVKKAKNDDVGKSLQVVG